MRNLGSTLQDEQDRDPVEGQHDRRPPTRTSSCQSPKTTSKRDLLVKLEKVDKVDKPKGKEKTAESRAEVRAARRQRRMLRKAQSERNFGSTVSQPKKEEEGSGEDTKSDEIKNLRGMSLIRSTSGRTPKTNSRKELMGVDEEEPKEETSRTVTPNRSRGFGTRFRLRTVSQSPVRNNSTSDTSQDPSEAEESGGGKERTGRLGILQRLTPRRPFRSQSPKPSRDLDGAKTPKKGFFCQTRKSSGELTRDNKPRLPPSITISIPTDSPIVKKSIKKVADDSLSKPEENPASPSSEATDDPSSPVKPSSVRRSSWGVLTISPISKSGASSRILAESILSTTEEDPDASLDKATDDLEANDRSRHQEEDKNGKQDIDEQDSAAPTTNELARLSSWGLSTIPPTSNKLNSRKLSEMIEGPSTTPSTPTDAKEDDDSSWGATTLSPVSRKKTVRKASLTATKEEPATTSPSSKGDKESAGKPTTLDRDSSWGATTLSPVARKKSLHKSLLTPTKEETAPVTPTTKGESVKPPELDREDSWGMTDLVLSPSPDKSSKGKVKKSSKKSKDPMAFGHASMSELLQSPMLMSDRKRRQPRFAPVPRNKGGDDNQVKPQDYRKMQLLINNKLMAKSDSMSNLMASPASTPTITNRKGGESNGSTALRRSKASSSRGFRRSSLDLVSPSKPFPSSMATSLKSRLSTQSDNSVPPPPPLPPMSSSSPRWGNSQRANKSSLLDD